MASSMSAPGPGRPAKNLPLPLLMRVLAVLTLCAGLWGALTSLGELNGVLLSDRTSAVVRARDRQLLLYDQAQTARPGLPVRWMRPFVEPLLRLQRADAERLSLLLGDELYERRRVNAPLALLNLILSWLLLTGSLGTLRRQAWGPSMWGWACMVSIPFALLSMLVTFVHSRTLLLRLGRPIAEALAKATSRSVELHTHELWQLRSLYVVSQAALLGLWVLFLGATVLYLQRHAPRDES